MKDSGIRYIGEIPQDWEVKRVKYVGDSFSKGNGITKEQVYEDGDIQCVRYGEIYSKYNYSFTTTYSRTNHYDISSPKHIKKGDILFAGTGELIEEIGKNIVYLGDDPCLVGGDIIVMKHHQNASFLNYALGSACSQNQKSEGKAKLKVVHISSTDIGNIIIALPSIDEQTRIADFLDAKRSEIDALSKDIQSEIDILESFKRSVITEAVTKGLNMNVPMKDSGMAWIGMVPEHWKIEKIKYHLVRKETKNHADKQVLSVYREYGVIPKDSRDDNHNVTSEDTSKYKYVKPGNLVINKMKAWQGSMGVSDFEGIVSPAYFIYHFIDDLFEVKYIHYLFRNCYKDEFRRISGGIREGQWDLSPSAFGNTMLLIPPINEQKQIVEKIESSTKKIEKIIEKKREQLEILSAFKQSLIYEYVTGKKEVPAV